MYSDSKIFKATFTCKDDGNDQYRNRLTESLANFRERVGVLIDGTPKDVPGLTVHDLTHMDALWDMLDILTGGDYRLNPAEAYVLGGAILLHDSAMTISIYPNGVNELKETAEYIDAYAYFEDNSHLAKEDDGYLIAAQGYAISDTLRLKHAENAETLATQKWDSKVSDGAFYLIDDSELREHYAHSIGRVAHSHHWDVDKAVSELSHCKGAFTGFPADWNVNEIKLALILRCIDAMHLDDRRAPTFTSALRTINEESAIHWKFQSKLAQPTLVSRKIQYTSKSPFTIEEASAWNLCFDTIQMVDLELRNASDIQERLSIQRFEAQGVVGSGSPGALAQHIQVKDWTPIPLNLQVSDVPSLALTLGGTDLYDFPLTPIREMIQNSADAIEARAVLDEDFDVGDGKIVIKLMEVEGKGHVLEITDNGVGMSERILTKVLLDFGMSFWKSKAARSEFPGLQKHTNKFRGRYGIG
ncbi:HD domain-containing protein, partial [Vibrio tasmaniensis]